MKTDYRVLSSLLVICLVGECVADNVRTNYLDEYLPEESDCPGETDRSLENKLRPWGEPNRAFHTLPDGLEIKNSSIPGAGLGVFTWIFIPKFTFLGIYEGEIVSAGDISTYAWEVRRNSETDYFVDGGDIETSSWQRFVNCPRHKIEENVEVYACRGKVVYGAKRDIYPGEELFVYYGEEYARRLGIDIYRYKTDWNRLRHWDDPFKQQVRASRGLVKP